jgi:hypothetical protein
MKTLRTFGLALLLAGCASAPEPTTPQVSAAASESLETCKSLFARQATCTDEFIPMLVDTRIRHDKPPGITARAKDAGRDALIAQAKEEWKVDGAEPARTATCQKIAPRATPAMLAQGRACLEKASCADFVACMAPFHDARIAEQK